MDINLSLLDPERAHGRIVSREQLAYGVYFGCVLMLLVWSGLVFVAVRDAAFLAYFALRGHLRRVHDGEHRLRVPVLLARQPALGQHLLPVLLCLSLIDGTAVLHHHPACARLHAAHWNASRACCRSWRCSRIALTPFLPYAVLIRPVTFLILLSVIFMIALGIVSLLAGSRPARFYVVAWGAFLAGSIVFLLKNFGLVPHTFMSQHSWQVGALLEMILLSMTLSSRMNELKHQSRTDPLTLLGNRRLFDDRLPIEFAQARESHRPLSLLVIDIDNFKAYNDRHGHSLGDEAIKLVAPRCDVTRASRYCACRYGGDEFCVILPGTGADGRGADRRARARQRRSPRAPTSARITVSVGYASLADDQFAIARQAVRRGRCGAVCRQGSRPQSRRGIPRPARRRPAAPHGSPPTG